jgi:hypothetical protein
MLPSRSYQLARPCNKATWRDNWGYESSLGVCCCGRRMSPRSEYGTAGDPENRACSMKVEDCCKPFSSSVWPMPPVSSGGASCSKACTWNCRERAVPSAISGCCRFVRDVRRQTGSALCGLRNSGFGRARSDDDLGRRPDKAAIERLVRCGSSEL